VYFAFKFLDKSCDPINNQVKCENHGSHFILSGFKYYVLTFKNKYNVLIVLMFYCKSLLVLLRWDTGKVRDRCGGMGRFMGKEWVSCVITDVIT